jgi:hypothetical protein
MIRIDEIYNHTFWPWIKDHLPFTRMFFCDPPGDSRPTALLNFGSDIFYCELQYIFFHDQEPIHLDTHQALFEEVIRRNKDLDHGQGAQTSIIVTSEQRSESVRKACDIYGWKDFYYFFHGWAALDWFRGYHRSFLMPEPDQRKITHSFISANRIIGGRRDHRIMLMYHMLQAGVKNAWISFPRVCPAERQDVIELSAKFGPEVQQTFSQADLPFCFPGETGHPMHSCWLSLFEENASSLAHVVTETVYSGRRHHLTEKTFKPICLRMPFVLVSTAGSLEYLRQYGFQTFDHIWHEDYDLEIDDEKRLEKIARLLKDLDDQSPRELQRIYQAAVPVLEHNFQHFYSGGFEQVLWQELVNMLDDVKLYVNAH